MVTDTATFSDPSFQKSVFHGSNIHTLHKYIIRIHTYKTYLKMIKTLVLSKTPVIPKVVCNITYQEPTGPIRTGYLDQSGTSIS